MKKIIDNKIYDTEKANKIFEFRKKCQGQECWFMRGHYFYYWTNVQIYKTSKENYFLHYNEAEGYNESIEKISGEEVKATIKKLDPDKYIELFGMIELEEA